MGKHACALNTQELNEYFDILADREQRRRIMVRSLCAGAQLLVDSTRQSLIRRVPTASQKMINGVAMGVDRDYVTVWVSILKDHRLKWFETGTAPRYKKVYTRNAKGHRRVDKTKKGAYTGQMEGRWFFKAARENTDVEGAVLDEFAQELRHIWH